MRADSKAGAGETRPPKRGSYLSAALINVVLLIMVTRLPEWRISFLTEDFSRVLWSFYLYLGAQVAGSLAMNRCATHRLHLQLDIAYRALSVLVSLVLLAVFPFDFSALSIAWFAPVVRALLGLICAGTLIGALRQLRRLARLPRDEG